jgi:hypothetical protein
MVLVFHSLYWSRRYGRGIVTHVELILLCLFGKKEFEAVLERTASFSSALFLRSLEAVLIPSRANESPPGLGANA